MRKINKEDLKGILENAYGELANKNWYAFSIGHNSDTNNLVWYERKNDNELLDNNDIEELYTVYPVKFIEVDNKLAKEYLLNNDTDTNLLENNEVLKRVYEICYKDNSNYDDFEDFKENGYFYNENLEKACPEKFEKLINETKEMLQDQYKQDNDFAKMSLDEKAGFLVTEINKNIEETLTLNFRFKDIDKVNEENDWDRGCGDFEKLITDIVSNVKEVNSTYWDTYSLWYDSIYYCDFTFNSDLTDEEIDKIEEKVNEVINIDRTE